MLARVASEAMRRLDGRDIIHPIAAIGSCGCGGGTCATCMPEPIEKMGKIYMPRDWAPTAAQVADPQWMRMAVARGCITEIFSEIVTVAAGLTLPVNVQPSQDCFIMLQERMVVVADADTQQRARALYNRAFRGDCAIDCQNIAAFTDFKDTDDCAWCPARELTIGRTVDTKQFRRDVTALGIAVRAQIGLRGICYEDSTCWRGYSSCTACSNGNGHGGAGAGGMGSLSGGSKAA